MMTNMLVVKSNCIKWKGYVSVIKKISKQDKHAFMRLIELANDVQLVRYKLTYLRIR